jgi:hypothetical protein
MIKFGSQAIAIKGSEKENGWGNLAAEMYFLSCEVLVLHKTEIWHYD